MLATNVSTDAEIYAAHAAELTAFATSMLGPSDAPDAVSAAVLGAISSAGWAGVANHRAYLYRSVYNECCRMAKRRAQRPTRERQAATRIDFELPTLRPEVAVAVRGLSPQQRAVVVLTYWQDLSIADVAEWLGISDGAVRKHLARARSNLREVLRD